MVGECPVVVRYRADLQSLHGFHCYDNSAEREMSATACTCSMPGCICNPVTRRTKTQRVLILLVLCSQLVKFFTTAYECQHYEFLAVRGSLCVCVCVCVKIVAEPGMSRCPLCHRNIASSEQSWRTHLMSQGDDGCPQNARRRQQQHSSGKKGE